jgi:hypothetical protein
VYFLVATTLLSAVRYALYMRDDISALDSLGIHRVRATVGPLNEVIMAFICTASMWLLGDAFLVSEADVERRYRLKSH